MHLQHLGLVQSNVPTRSLLRDRTGVCGTMAITSRHPHCSSSLRRSKGHTFGILLPPSAPYALACDEGYTLIGSNGCHPQTTAETMGSMNTYKRLWKGSPWSRAHPEV